MLKNLTFIAAACLFATTGCTLTIGGGTDSDSDTASSTDASGTSSTSASTGGSTSGGTDSGTTAETSPTTTSPTTGGSTSTTAASTTDASSTSGSTGGMSAYGMCGWFADGGYYACAADGAMAGVADPNGTPIDCPDPLPAEGDKCDEMGPITGQGCCLPDGSNYYCDNQGQITKVDCGA